MDEKIMTLDDLERIALINLTFQRYVHRRLLGVGYAIWASVIMFFLLIPSLFNMIHLDSDLKFVFYIVTSVAIILIAVLFDTHFIKVVIRESELRFALGDRYEKRHGPMHALTWALTIFTSIILAIILIPSFTNVVLYLAFIPLAVHMHLSLRRTFQVKLPIEAVIAIGTFTATIVLGLTIAIFNKSWSSDAIFILWAMTAIVWYFASVYALFHAPDELWGFTEA